MHILLNKNLSKNLTGIEHSSLNRFKLFKMMGLNVGYATILFNLDLVGNANKLGVLFEDLYNPYLFFLKYNEINDNIEKKDFSELKRIELANGDIKLYDENNLVMYVGYHDVNSIKFINYFIDNKIIKREFYTKNKCVLEILFSNDGERKKVCEIYYNNKGEVTIEKNYKKCGLELESIYVYYSNKIEVFKNFDEFISFWLSKQIIESFEKIYFYIDRPLRYNKSLFGLVEEKIKLIGIIHAIHYNHYRNHMVGNLLTGYKQYFDNADKMQAIVVGTKLQKDDIVERFRIYDKLYVIPPSSIGNFFIENICKNSCTEFITVGRLAPEKRIDYIIKSFELVAKKGYRFKLKIFGIGPDFVSLKKLVDELNLSSSIEFLGYSNNIINEISKAQFSLITSSYEGFNISIIESFSCGTPILSYDVKYGPKALIKNNYNGFLVEDGNIDLYANKLIDIINNPELINVMSNNAKNSAVEFMQDSVVEKWISLIESI